MKIKVGEPANAELTAKIFMDWATVIVQSGQKPMLCVGIDNTGKSSLYTVTDLDPSLLVISLRTMANQIEQIHSKK